jgi:hypothetical protein
MDAIRHETNDVVADGEVVWFWRSDAGAKVAGLNESDDRRWQPSMVTGKSTKETVKTIVQGMPAVAVYPWLLTRVLFAAHAASGATRIRHSLRPCSHEGGSLQKLGRLAPRECGLLSPSAVIPRHRFSLSANPTTGSGGPPARCGTGSAPFLDEQRLAVAGYRSSQNRLTAAPCWWSGHRPLAGRLACMSPRANASPIRARRR